MFFAAKRSGFNHFELSIFSRNRELFFNGQILQSCVQIMNNIAKEFSNEQ